MYADLGWTCMVMTTGNEGYIILTAKYLAENKAACAWALVIYCQKCSAK